MEARRHSTKQNFIPNFTNIGQLVDVLSCVWYCYIKHEICCCNYFI